MLQNQNNENTVAEFEALAQENIPQGEIVLGELNSIDDNGQAQVTFSLNKRYGPVTALATVPLTTHHIGRQVGLLFTQNAERTPVIVGIVHNAFHSLLENIEIAESTGDEEVFESSLESDSSREVDDENDVLVDGEKVVLEGKEKVVLRCGDSSITLHKNGKISIRGKYLLNRSSGVNRIMGGSVQVN